MEEKQREAIGLKKFSIISPVLNKQVKSTTEYFNEVASKPIEMPHLGMRKYSPKTLKSWLYDYRRYGLSGLFKNQRSDKGKSRKVTEELSEKIKQLRQAHPHMPVSVLYERLIAEEIIKPEEISRPTIYRHVEDLNIRGAFLEQSIKKESRRFSHENVNEVWQADILYGPAIKIGKKTVQTYLHAIIDDCSRLPVWSEFYLSQNFETLRHCFKEAVLRRGVPRLLYTDNGKIYRSQQIEFICASLGTTLVHSEPFVPQGRGKIERYFKTVRMRFLNALDTSTIKDIDTLNARYRNWLEEDYVKKAHDGLDGLTPRDVFMSQAANINLIGDKTLIDEHFLYRITRKIHHDATLQIDKVLYETDVRFAGKRMEIRYDPDWLGSDTKELPVYHEGKKVGSAKMVRFHDNALAKRKYPGNRKKNQSTDSATTKHGNTISFVDLLREEVDHV